MKRICKTMKVAAVAIILFAAGPAAAQDETVPVTFGWAPGPLQDEDGWPTAPAIRYEVYLQRGSDDGEEYLATVVRDTTYILAAERGIEQRIRVYGLDERGRRSVASEWSDHIYFEPERTQQSPDRLPPPQPALDQNYPNPFNPETRLVYGVPEGTPHKTRMALEIYTLRGQRVRSFPISGAGVGWHEVTWDGRDDHGLMQATGTYVTRYVCGDQIEVGKMTMVK